MISRLGRLKWSLRKLTLPIYGKGLIVDVGSGGNPHPFADVLLEKYVDTSHRYKPLKADRPTVLADATKMPFRDNAFSYSFAFHILEHLHEPEKFLTELQRVSSAGYIETPNALYERITPFDVHLLEIVAVNGVLNIYKKNGPVGDDFIGQISLLDKDPEWRRFFYKNPRMFHTCYQWRDEIRFNMLNPDQTTSWFEDPETSMPGEDEVYTKDVETSLRSKLIGAVRSFRSRSFALDDILACTECGSSVKKTKDKRYTCQNNSCGAQFAADPLPDFNAPI